MHLYKQKTGVDVKSNNNIWIIKQFNLHNNKAKLNYVTLIIINSPLWLSHLC